MEERPWFPGALRALAVWGPYRGPPLLLQRRPGRGQDDLVLLRDEAVATAGRRPHALLARLVAHLHALIHARVRPDVHEAVGLAELHAAGEHDGGELHPLGQLRLPALGGVGERARL